MPYIDNDRHPQKTQGQRGLAHARTHVLSKMSGSLVQAPSKPERSGCARPRAWAVGLIGLSVVGIRVVELLTMQ